MIEISIIALVCLTALTIFVLWLDRLHPKPVPFTSAEEMRKEMDEFKDSVDKSIVAMNSRISMSKNVTRLRE
jgi:hypothetical protein